MIIHYYMHFEPLVTIDPVVDDFGTIQSLLYDFDDERGPSRAFGSALEFLETAGALGYSEGGVH